MSLPDFTRWNRAGLSRLRYVEGDAASRLDDLRRSHLAQFLRGAPDDFRKPEFWRRLFALPPDERPAGFDPVALAKALQWKALWHPVPDEAEDVTARVARLRDDYFAPPGEPAFEIARAFARALHVHLGTIDAFANEGFIRTATQWENAKRLAAMVGYAPAPPASATTDIALIAKGAGPSKVARGLAMRWKPAKGTPLVFETLADLVVHPDLNAARVSGWDRNLSVLPANLLDPPDDHPVRWFAGNAAIAAGDVVVLVPDSGSDIAAFGAVVSESASVGEGLLEIRLDRDIPANAWPRVRASLRGGAGAPRRARPRRSDGRVVHVTGGGRFGVGDVVAWSEGTGFGYAHVVAVDGSRVTLSAAPAASEGNVRLLQLGRTVRDTGSTHFVTAPSITSLVALKSDGTIAQATAGDPTEVDNKVIARNFDATGFGFTAFMAPTAASPGVDASVVAAPPNVGIGLGDPANTVEFEGAAPPGLVRDSFLAARVGDQITPLRVVGVRSEEDRHFVAFAAAPPADALFHGPFPAQLRPEHWDHAATAAFDSDGSALLTGLSAEAIALLKPGRTVIVEDERGVVPPITARILAAAAGETASTALMSLKSDVPLTGFIAGWTVFRLNVVRAGHGETRGPKTLGSGDAERMRQSYLLDEPELSFVPDPTAPTGVAADLDVAVDGVLWHQVPISATIAEGADAYHVARREAGGYDIVFRRRLPTGRDNISVRRQRVGVGPDGNAVPSFGLTEPMKPHPAVAAIRQPFASSGGAAPEPVALMRENAPAHLKALDRAVSAEDYALLVARHAKVLRARAEPRFVSGREDIVRVTVVPADGGALTPTLRDELTAFLAARSLPGARAELVGYQPLGIVIDATIRVDVSRYDPELVRETAIRVVAERFSLTQRGLGQPLYIAEILAALETVEGLAAATATLDLAAGAPAPRRLRPAGDGPYRAIFVQPGQVAYVTDAAFVRIAVEPLS